MNNLFIYSTNREPGTWKGVVDRSKTPARRGASIICPNCGNVMVIGIDSHTINADGIVQPSVVCPVRGCTFHEYIRLDGWKENRP